MQFDEEPLVAPEIPIEEKMTEYVADDGTVLLQEKGAGVPTIGEQIKTDNDETYRITLVRGGDTITAVCAPESEREKFI